MEREINLDSILALDRQIELEGHEETSIRLKRIRNSLLNVSTFLPPEILGDIFCRNATPDRDFGGLPEGSYNFLLVCHHWLEVASRTPELWRFWGNTVREWLHRHAHCWAAPLELVLSGDTGHRLDDRLRDALKNRAARDVIRRIHLRTLNTGLLDSIISAIATDGEGTRSSSVESFAVRNNRRCWVDVSAFFSRYHLPKLQHLSLRDCRISSWDLVKLQTMSLTTLELTGELSPVPTTPQLLEILSSNPLLQHLILFHIDDPNLVDDDRTSPLTVPLRQLKKIDITGSFFPAFKLLNHLALPDKMDNMALEIFNCSRSDISQIFGPYIGDHVRRRGRILDEGLGIRSCPTPGWLDLSVGGVCEGGDPGGVVWFVEAAMLLDAELEDEESNRLHFELTARIPLEKVTNLQTALPILRSEELCIQMCNLTYLYLDGADLSTWSVEPEISGPHTFKDLLCGLDHIEITEARLGGGWDAITNFLSRRAAVGKRISSLSLNGSLQMDENMAESVKRVVDVFEYGGRCI